MLSMMESKALAFAHTPRTAKDIGMFLGLLPKHTYPLLESLLERGLLIMHTSTSGPPHYSAAPSARAESGAREVEWYFQWESGGYNHVVAKTKAEAVEKAKKLGAPREFYTMGEHGMSFVSKNPPPGAIKHMTKGLKPVVSSFEKGTPEVAERYRRMYAGMFD